MSVLLCYSLKLDEGTHRRDYHPFDHFHTTGEARSHIGNVAGVIPHLTVSAVAIPTEVAVGNCIKRQELEAPQQTVLFRHVHLFP